MAVNQNIGVSTENLDSVIEALDEIQQSVRPVMIGERDSRGASVEAVEALESSMIDIKKQITALDWNTLCFLKSYGENLTELDASIGAGWNSGK